MTELSDEQYDPVEHDPVKVAEQYAALRQSGHKWTIDRVALWVSIGTFVVVLTVGIFK